MADNRFMSAASDASARVRAQLDALGLPYEVIEIDPALAETAQFCERYGFPLETSANTIIVGSKKSPKSYCACVVRADRRLDVNHRVKKLMAAGKVSFAPAEETVELTGMPIGDRPQAVADLASSRALADRRDRGSGRREPSRGKDPPRPSSGQ